MPDQINGLPAHVLLVHVVIALIPLAALALAAGAVWPTLRRRLGVLTPLLAFVALASVPVTTHAGGWLRNHLPGGLAQTPLVQQHVRLGHTLLPWALGIFVVSVAVWWVDRRYVLAWRPEPAAEGGAAAGSGGTAPAMRTRARTALPTWVTAVVAVVAVVVSIGGVYQLYRIGDSGAKAVWTGNFSQTATSPGGG